MCIFWRDVCGFDGFEYRYHFSIQTDRSDQCGEEERKGSDEESGDLCAGVSGGGCHIGNCILYGDGRTYTAGSYESAGYSDSHGNRIDLPDFLVGIGTCPEGGTDEKRAVSEGFEYFRAEADSQPDQYDGRQHDDHLSFAVYDDYGPLNCAFAEPGFDAGSGGDDTGRP